MTKKWTHDEPRPANDRGDWECHCTCRTDDAIALVTVVGTSSNACSDAAGLICAAPELVERIDKLEHTIREVLGELEWAYNGRYDNVRRNMWQQMDEKFSRIVTAIRELRGVLI